MTEHEKSSAVVEETRETVDTTSQPETTDTTVEKKNGSNKTSLALSAIAIAIALAAGVGLYGLVKQQGANQTATSDTLVNQLTSLQKAQETQKTELEAVIKQQAAALAEANSKQQELTKQLDEVQQKVATISGTDAKTWLLSQADFLVKLAGRKLWSDQDVTTAAALLKSADASLADMNDPSLITARRAITEDIASLSAVSQVDYDGIILKVNQLSNQIDNLQLADNNDDDSPMDSDGTELSSSLSEWRINLQKSWQNFMDSFITIRRRDETAVPLLAPNQDIYLRENIRSRLLWFFEGFTSYYDDLLLRRAGLLDDAGYLKLLTKTANQVLQAPGRQVQSVAQASFDAWLRYYRPDENTPNSTVSYYTKGALVALCFDLTLRHETEHTLDDAMRALWRRCRGGPMTEGDFAAVMAELGGRSFAREIADWVHGTAELPLKALLESQGVKVLEEPSQLAQTLGLRVAENGGITLKVVLDGGPAAEAGMAAGDEWLGVELPAARTKGSATHTAGWRLTRLDELPLFAGKARRVVALVARDKRLLRLPLVLPEKSTTWRLAPKNGSDAHPWPGR